MFSRVYWVCAVRLRDLSGNAKIRKDFASERQRNYHVLFKCGGGHLCQSFQSILHKIP